MNPLTNLSRAAKLRESVGSNICNGKKLCLTAALGFSSTGLVLFGFLILPQPSQPPPSPPALPPPSSPPSSPPSLPPSSPPSSPPMPPPLQPPPSSPPMPPEPPPSPPPPSSPPLPPLRADDVVFLGDSITAGWNFIEQYGFDNLGDGGKTTTHMINRLLHGCWYREACGDAPILNMSVEVLHLMGGTNDLAGNGDFYPSVQDIALNLANISTIATSHGMHVLLASVLPASNFYWRPEAPPPSARIVQLNALLAAFASTTTNVTFIDYHTPLVNEAGGIVSIYTTDGVHVSASGYAVMETVLIPQLFG